jgi:predicted metal-binding protein
MGTPRTFQELVQAALTRKADHAAMVQTDQIRFVPAFRKACEQDTCRKYGSNWMCPPGIGPIEELRARAQSFKQGLLVQTVHAVAGSFDLKGMYAAKKDHDPVFRDILAYFQGRPEFTRLLPLDAGACELCPRCTYLDDQTPCRFPDLAIPAMEAYGIDVINLEKAVGIPYYHGPNAVGYVGLILFETN